MLNKNSLNKVQNSFLYPGFRAPLYKDYCFSNIPDSIKKWLGIPGTEHVFPGDITEVIPPEYEHVVLFFIDALGWHSLEHFKDEIPAVKALMEQSSVSCLSSMFPSTTAAHLTLIHGNQLPAESGVFEFYYYEPEVDSVINPLLYSWLRDCKTGKRKRETLAASGVNAEDLFIDHTFYNELATAGVNSFIYQTEAYTPSSYSDWFFRGAEVRPFNSYMHGVEMLIADIKQQKEKSYHFIYGGMVDDAAHGYGPYSPEAKKAIEEAFCGIETFVEGVKGQCSDTLVLVTADHGQVTMDPEKVFYLDQEIPELKEMVKTNSKGEFLAPAGSNRDFFLVLKEGYEEKAYGLIKEALEGKALVLRTKELAESGVFNTKEFTSSFTRKLGHVTILPDRDNNVFWSNNGDYYMPYRGNHGGLTPEETDIPFICHAF